MRDSIPIGNVSLFAKNLQMKIGCCSKLQARVQNVAQEMKGKEAKVNETA